MKSITQLDAKQVDPASQLHAIISKFNLKIVPSLNVKLSDHITKLYLQNFYNALYRMKQDDILNQENLDVFIQNILTIPKDACFQKNIDAYAELFGIFHHLKKGDANNYFKQFCTLVPGKSINDIRQILFNSPIGIDHEWLIKNIIKHHKMLVEINAVVTLIWRHIDPNSYPPKFQSDAYYYVNYFEKIVHETDRVESLLNLNQMFRTYMGFDSKECSDPKMSYYRYHYKVNHAIFDIMISNCKYSKPINVFLQALGKLPEAYTFSGRDALFAEFIEMIGTHASILPYVNSTLLRLENEKIQLTKSLITAIITPWIFKSKNDKINQQHLAIPSHSIFSDANNGNVLSDSKHTVAVQKNKTI